MAAPTYASDLSDIVTDMASTTGWTALGGGASGLVAPETDFFIQGSNCISKAAWTAATKGMIFGAGAGVTVPSGKALFYWWYYWAQNSLDTEANGGVQMLIGSSAAAFKQYYLKGSDTDIYGGWINDAVDPTLAADATTGAPSATLQFFGVQCKVVGGPTKGQPLGIDAIRYGRDFTCTNGDLANGYATFAGAATFNDNISRRYGQFQAIDGGYLMKGRFLMGSSGTAVDFRDSNRSITIQNTKKVGSTFNTFEVQNASSNVSWTNINIAALGTVSRGEFVVTDNATIAKNTCVFTDMGAFTYKSSSTLTNCTYRRCNLITQGGATFSGCTFDSTNDSTRAVTADNASLFSSCKFVSSGTKHGLEIRPTGAGPFNYTLSACTFTGYAGSDGSTGNEAVYINPVTGSANITLNITNGGTTPSIRLAAGYSGTFTLVTGSVTITITVKTTTGTAIQNALVYIEAATGGPFPYQVTVTITRSGSTATVSHTGHGLSTGDYVKIKGANQPEYNGAFSITKIDANSYSYTVSGTPATPATGTIKSTFVVLDALSNVSGVASVSRSFPSDQPITGRVRKASGSPYYKDGLITGTITTTAGFTATVQLVRDE